MGVMARLLPLVTGPSQILRPRGRRRFCQPRRTNRLNSEVMATRESQSGDQDPDGDVGPSSPMNRIVSSVFFDSTTVASRNDGTASPLIAFEGWYPSP